MILIEGPNKKPYAVVLANGRIELDAENPRARELLAEKYPNLVATFDNQEEADTLVDDVLKHFRAKGTITGAEADLFTKLEDVERKRKARKGAR